MANIAFSESCQPKRFIQCWSKVEKKYTQQQQPNQFHCYSQIMGFVYRMDRNVAKSKTGIWMKKWWWSMYVWMVDVVPQSVLLLYRIYKGEGNIALKMKFFIKGFFRKYDQIRRKRRLWSHFLNKYLTKNFIFCAVRWVPNSSSFSKRCYQCNFSEIFWILSLSQVGIMIYPNRYLLWWQKTLPGTVLKNKAGARCLDAAV